LAQAGNEGVRAEIARAERRAKTRTRGLGLDPPVGEPRIVDGERVRPGEWTPAEGGLPPDCPVKPLGREGSLLHVIDAKGQLITIKPSAFGQGEIASLFGQRIGYLYWAWPRFSAKGFVDAWRAEKVREALYKAAGPLPLFSATNHVRGRGAWLTRGQELIYHSGSALWSSTGGRLSEEATGLKGRDFYEMLPDIPAPWPEKLKPADNPARELLTALRSWHWERPLVDPVLMLGWIGAAAVSGALEWRPNLYVTGDRATGKSQMLSLVKAALGDGLVKSADASAAGITQKLRHDALPVALDELEAEADGRAANAILKLAKIASSGDGKLRGGADHTGVEFTIRSCFLFSSINPPALRPEDVSRMGVLRLRPLAEFPSRLKEAPRVDEERTASQVLRVMMDAWARFPQALEAYYEVLRSAGHPDRGQKTFGTLLACADLMLGPELADELGVPMVDDLSPWGELLATGAMSEYEDMNENWRACLVHLLTSRVEAWRQGKRHTVGQLLDDLRHDFGGIDTELDMRRANELLAQAGLRVLAPREIEGETNWILCVPNESQLVAQQFRDTRWLGSAGASVWKNALRQGPRDVVITDKRVNKLRINGAELRCTLIRLQAFEALG